MAQQNSKPLKVLIPKVRQSCHVDTVVSESLRVLCKPESVEPSRNIFGHPAASTLSRF